VHRPIENNVSQTSSKTLFHVISKSPVETQALGKKLAVLLTEDTVVAFFGELGSGKTTCIKGICAGLDVEETVTSPTFTLINEYKGRLPIFHFDFYRINSTDDLHDIGVSEYWSKGGISLIEWPEIILNELPVNRFEVHLSCLFENGLDSKRDIIVYRHALLL
jgi:tRNA threonylcarbamoyladenosine biosynthesis protein TsaE